MNGHADRLMQVENALLDVDEIVDVVFNQFAIPISGATQQLTVVMKNKREIHLYHTSLNEFKALRAPYFEERPTKATNLEEGWDLMGMSTQWSYMDFEGEWVVATNLAEALNQSRKYGTKSRADVQRNLRKEWDADGE